MDDLKERVAALLDKFNIFEKQKRIKELEREASLSSFWQDNKRASTLMKELADLKTQVEEVELLQKLINEGKDSEAKDILEKLETFLYLSKPYDVNNAILSIHAGQGGVEAMDWTAMLARMYTRFFERKGWNSDIVEETPGDEAGLKTVTVTVEEPYAYGYLRRESGIHRLVRQSPFNADKLRQTSFALVEVLPQIEDAKRIEIKEDDLDWEFYRASSHGGQNVQKVSSAVRLRHKPTGIVVTAQAQRYQAQNREYAMKLLLAKLWHLQEEENRKKERELRGEYKTPGWGNQIRSYVLHPYHMVKDLRTGFETSNTEAVLDGEIDNFVEQEIRMLS